VPRMALLESRDRRCFLGADSLIGREPGATLRLDDESVSWRHASVRWTGLAWELQDLGSRNGTFLNGQPVAPGSRIPLRLGAELRFGEAKDVWHLVNGDAPTTSVVDIATGERIFAADDLITLPLSEEPELSITRQANGEWVAELASLVCVLSPMEVVTVGLRRYRFEPGAPVYATLAGRPDQPTLGSLELEFTVSRDEDFASVTLIDGAKRISLKPRAHTYMLVTLARLRLQDQSDPSLPPNSHGWVDQERLVKMLATNPTQLAVDIYRARKQFSEAGVLEAAQLVERRTTSHELRLGVSRLRVVVA